MVVFTPAAGKNVAQRMGERDELRAQSMMEREELEAVSFTFPLNEWEELGDVLKFVQQNVGDVKGNELTRTNDGKHALVVFCEVPAKNVGSVYAEHVKAMYRKERGGAASPPPGAGSGAAGSAERPAHLFDVLSLKTGPGNVPSVSPFDAAQTPVKSEPVDENAKKGPQPVQEERVPRTVAELNELARVVECTLQNVNFMLPFDFYMQIAMLSKAQRAFFLNKVKYVDDDEEREEYAKNEMVFVQTWGKVVHGWYVCHKRDEFGELLHLPQNLSQRAELFNALVEEGEWSDMHVMKVLSLTLDAFDNVMNDLDASHNNRKSNATPGRREALLQRELEQMTKRDDEDYWWNDAESTPFKFGVNDYVRDVYFRYENGRRMEMERQQVQATRAASRPPRADVKRDGENMFEYLERLYFEQTGRAGGRRGNESREAAYARGKREASGASSTAAPPVKRGSTGQSQNVGFARTLNVQERVSCVADGMRDPEIRDHLHAMFREGKRNELLKYVTATRSDVVDRRFIEDLDNKNVERLARFERWAQDLFVRCFHVKPDVRNVNAHVGTVLEHLRRCVERGVTPEEGQRLALIVERGEDVSMKECDRWAIGTCRFGSRCRYFHIGSSGAAIDALDSAAPSRGRSSTGARRISLDDDDI